MKKAKALSSFFLLVVLMSSSVSQAGSWDLFHAPERMGQGIVYFADQLPLQGEVKQEQMPWSDFYWPSTQGGISNRWNDLDDSLSSTQELFSLSVLKGLSRSTLSRLSPAEKFDIWTGRYRYPLTVGERKRTETAKLDWEGLCHGWAIAAIHHREPQSVTVKSRDGLVDIPFSSSDIKALLAYAYGVVHDGAYSVVGKSCGSRFSSWRNKGGCSGVNAGSFHLILSNWLGLQKRSFVADLDRTEEVWNYPVVKFSSKVLRMQPPSLNVSARVASEWVVETEITYVDGIQPSALPVLGTSKQKIAHEVYQYTLELDRLGRVVGGEWISWNRPTLLWNRPQLTGGFARAVEGLDTLLVLSGSAQKK